MFFKKKETNHWQQGKSTFHTLDLYDPSRNLDSLVLRLTNDDPGKEGESRLGVELVGDDGLAEAKSRLRPNPARASQAQLWSALVALSWSKLLPVASLLLTTSGWRKGLRRIHSRRCMADAVTGDF